MRAALAPFVISATPEAVLRKLTQFESYPDWKAAIRIKGEAVQGGTVDMEVRSRMPWTRSLAIQYPGRISELSSSRLAFSLNLLILAIELGFTLESVGGKCQVTPTLRVSGLGRWIAGARLRAAFTQAADETLRALRASFSKPPMSAKPAFRTRGRPRH